MLQFAVVLLCTVVGVFCHSSVPLPSSFRDENGNVFPARVDGAKLILYNSSGGLLSIILNEKGWVVVSVSDRGVCVIVDPKVVAKQGDCFEEVPYSGEVPDNVKKFCYGKAIVQHVRVDCSVETDGRKKRQFLTSGWSRCCRYIPVAWWPCYYSVCYQYNTFNQCVSWGCGQWYWSWHWVRICIRGYSWPFWG